MADGVVDQFKVFAEALGFDESGMPKRKTPKPHWSHAYYVKEGLTDVSKMRMDAARDAAGDNYCPEGACSIIHFHRLLEGDNEELTGCDRFEHEEYHRKSCPDANK